MKNNWKKYKLGEVLEKIVGGGTPSKSKSEYWNGSIAWATVKDMSDDKFSISQTQDFITEEGLKNSSSNLISAGTVITSTRMGLGRVFTSSFDVAINQDLKALIPNKELLNNRYLLWLISYLGDEIKSMGSGTTVKGIRLEQFRNIPITLPDINCQNKITSYLDSIDNLIENNEYRIQILEKIAQNLYEEWFVNFKFPGYEKTKMVDSELGKVPKGWEVKKLNDFVDVRDGTHDTPKKIKKGTSLITTKNIRGGYLLKSDYFISQDDFQEVSKRSKVEKWNILISMIGTVGEIHLVDYNPKYAIKNIGLIRTNNSKKSLFIFHYLKSKAGEEEIKSRMTGASQQFLSLTNLRNINLVIPSNSLLIEFDKHASLLQHKIRNLIEKNKVLRQTRDLLLPRLISGEIKL